MLDLLARHGRLDLDVTVTGDLADRRPPHRRGHRASCSGRRSTARSATARGIVRYGAATVPMDEARASCAIDISGRPFTLFDADLPPGSTGGFEHELTEEFFRALANAAKLTLHLRVEAGTNAHHMIEAAFKAFARALREAVGDRPDRDGRAEHEGDADRMSAACSRARRDRRRRLRHGQPPLGREGARARRRARRRSARDPRALRAAAGLVVPGVGAFPRAMAQPARAGLDELLRERLGAGTPVLGICLGMQLAFDSSTELGGAAGLGHRARRGAPAARRRG